MAVSLERSQVIELKSKKKAKFLEVIFSRGSSPPSSQEEKPPVAEAELVTHGVSIISFLKVSECHVFSTVSGTVPLALKRH